MTDVQVMETEDIDPDQTSGPRSMHVADLESAVDMHYPVIELLSSRRG